MFFLNEEFKSDPRLLNPLSLAYVGDAVMEVYVRTHLVGKRAAKPNQLHRWATRYVSAKAQSSVSHVLKEQLTEDEWWFFKRGRNAKSGTVPKNADVIQYRNSSGLECMLGYLYLSDQRERLNELLNTIATIVEAGDHHE